MKALSMITSLMIVLSAPSAAFASSVKPHIPKHSEHFKMDRKQELFRLVRTYTPEKTHEWEAAIKKREELKGKLHQNYKKDRNELAGLRKQWKEQNLSEEAIRKNTREWRESKHKGHPQHPDRKRVLQDLKRALKDKDEASIKESLNSMLKRVQSRNRELEQRVK
ncbi:hypothetical protein J9317_16505 [Metabacillus sp. KIGAM252]|uniref:DUF3106 domain-containing protein n=1 Tax=Metabacillus flavus TaxID=2823519 RepID=A0ABS5LHX9_9BACI|nr:hypothetical protein [Metabacillus flavus]MBS2970350.1 hypothetical protein [Metabacillus flavus]